MSLQILAVGQEVRSKPSHEEVSSKIQLEAPYKEDRNWIREQLQDIRSTLPMATSEIRKNGDAIVKLTTNMENLLLIKPSDVMNELQESNRRIMDRLDGLEKKGLSSGRNQ